MISNPHPRNFLARNSPSCPRLYRRRWAAAPTPPHFFWKRTQVFGLRLIRIPQKTLPVCGSTPSSWIPRGLIVGAASVMQGAGDRIMHFSLEGFPSHAAAKAAVPLLDSLRPDLARALSLFAIARSRSQAVVDSLALVGVGAAVVGRDGVLRAANDHFVQRLEDQLIDGRSGLRFADAFLQTSLSLALARHVQLKRGVQSVAIRSKDGARPCALHLLPIVGAAQEMCEADGILLLLSDPENRAVPSGDLLRLDVRSDASGGAVGAGTHRGRKSCRLCAVSSVQASLRQRRSCGTIFAKTGTSKQAELILLLTGIAPAVN